MDKILRRVRQAEANVARRVKRRDAVQNSVDRRERIDEVKRLQTEVKIQRITSVKARKEDLMLGPLAPNRDIYMKDPLGNYWGSISPTRALQEITISKEEKEARTAWCGGLRYLCLAMTDRVVVIEGPYKGKIGTITKINKENATVECAHDIKVNVTVPDFLINEDQTAIQLTAAIIPISAVRLVHPVRDPKTGVVRDAIIRELKPHDVRHDRFTRKVYFKRQVPGENVIIPWPKTLGQAYETYAGDTQRIDVDEKTFVPTLLRPPMPMEVINELRNPYSRFRTRHTDEYIAKVQELEDEKKARKQAAKTMLTPVQEYNRKLREERRALGQPKLTEQMLEKIGQVIAAKLEARKAAPKVEPVPAQVKTAAGKGKNALKRERRAKEQAEKTAAAVEQITAAEATAPETTTEQPKTE